MLERILEGQRNNMTQIYLRTESIKSEDIKGLSVVNSEDLNIIKALNLQSRACWKVLEELESHF